MAERIQGLDFREPLTGTIATAPRSYSRIVYSFDKLTLSKHQTLRVYLYEVSGARNLSLRLSKNFL